MTRRLLTLGGLLLSCGLAPSALRAQGPPNAPIDLEAVVSPDLVRLTWEADNSGGRRTAVLFRIYRDDEHIGTSSDEDHDDGAVTVGQTYVYEVSGVDILGREGDRSDPLTVTIVDETPPSVPDDVVATGETATRISVRWDASRDDESGVAGYRIYRNGGSTPIATVGGTTYNDTGLTPFTVYSYRVSAFNPSGAESARSASVAARTRDGSPPSTPTGLTAEGVSASEIRLGWTASSDAQTGVARYLLYRDGGSSPIDSTTSTTYTDDGLSGGTERTYRVAARNGEGLLSDPSDPASARPVDTSPPGAPGSLSAEATGARIVELAWSAASDPESGVALYLVYRGGAAQPIDSTTAQNYADTSVEPETSYSYRVAARNHAGLVGPRSEAVIATTPREVDVTPPTAPAGFSARAVGPSRIELSWQAADDAESGITLYRVYRDDALLGTSPGVGFADLTTEADTSYEYEVSAVNGEGLEGPRAEALTVTTPGSADVTPPAPPTNLRAVTE